MKKFFGLVFLFFTFLLLIFNLNSTNAQPLMPSLGFRSVVPFSTAGGFLGFFDQNTGYVYLYDQQWQACVQISKLNTLGTPMTRSK